jgi:hypothetical protein
VQSSSACGLAPRLTAARALNQVLAPPVREGRVTRRYVTREDAPSELELAPATAPSAAREDGGAPCCGTAHDWRNHDERRPARSAAVRARRRPSTKRLARRLRLVRALAAPGGIECRENCHAPHHEPSAGRCLRECEGRPRQAPHAEHVTATSPSSSPLSLTGGPVGGSPANAEGMGCAHGRIAHERAHPIVPR